MLFRPLRTFSPRGRRSGPIPERVLAMEKLVMDFARSFAWCIVAALSMGLSLGIVIRIFDMLTPGLDEIDELRKGNVAVAVVLGAVILACGFVIGMTLHSSPTP